MLLPVLSLLFSIGLAVAQYDQHYPTTTPVPILKQINKHNEDGSYSYGYEAADGSYKIESKYPSGEVYGKYGFVDDTGNVREIEYGASRRGFEPAGPGINVPPPTLTGNAIGSPNEPEDDGQYREDPTVYYTDPRYTNGERYENVPKQQNRPVPLGPPQQPPTQTLLSSYPAPVTYRPSLPVPSQEFQNEYRPRYQSQYPQQAQPQQRSLFAATSNPAEYQSRVPTSSSNIAVNSGLASYSVHYRR